VQKNVDILVETVERTAPDTPPTLDTASTLDPVKEEEEEIVLTIPVFDN
jgi:hypothetical protein